MAASDYKYVILGGGQAAGYTAREVGAGILPKSCLFLNCCPACMAGSQSGPYECLIHVKHCIDSHNTTIVI